jgi:hypothetical protein
MKYKSKYIDVTVKYNIGTKRNITVILIDLFCKRYKRA